VLEAEGRLRRIVPIVITTKNPDTNTRGGDSFFSFIGLMSDMASYLVF